MVEKKILFIARECIGDTVITTAILRHFRELMPDSRITVIADARYRSLFYYLPGKVRIFSRGAISGRIGWGLFFQRWDVIISGRICLFSLAGFWARKHITLNVFGVGHCPGESKLLLCAAKINRQTPPPAPYVFLGKEACEKARHIIPEEGKAIALSPFSSQLIKEWPIDYFATLIEKLRAGITKNTPIFIFGAPAQRNRSRYLTQRFPFIVNMMGVGHDLLTNIACINRCRILIGSDSGIAHMVGATGTIPVLDLFAHVDENVWRPWGRAIHTLRPPVSPEEWDIYVHGPQMLSPDIVYRKACDILTTRP